MARKTAEVSLHPHQLAALTASEPFVALVTGLGGGKTFAGANWIISRATSIPRGLHVAMGNSYRQIADVIMPAIESTLDALGIPWKFCAKADRYDLGGLRRARRGQRRYARLGSITLRSSEVHSKLRGTEVDSWWLDEARDTKKEAALAVFGRLRGKASKRAGDRPRCFWTTSPNGFDHVYDTFAAHKRKNYRLIQAASTANLDLDRDYVDALTEHYDSRMAQQEVGGQFVDLRGARAYFAFSRAHHCTPDAFGPDWQGARWVEYRPTEPLRILADFNVNPMTLIVCQDGIRNPSERGDRIQVPRVVAFLDEVWRENSSIWDAVESLKDQGWGAHPGPVIVHGDASGQQRHASTGRTDYAILISALEDLFARRVTLDVPSRNPPQRDRINAANWNLRGPDGRSRVWVSDLCEHLCRDFERVVLQDDGKIDKSDPMLTHPSDAASCYLSQHHEPSGFFRETDWARTTEARRLRNARRA